MKEDAKERADVGRMAGTLRADDAERGRVGERQE